MYVIPRRFPSRNYYPRGPGLLAIMALSTRELEVLELMGNGYTMSLGELSTALAT
jgi:DNA-binding NarL/FixJ family response regulator